MSRVGQEGSILLVTGMSGAGRSSALNVFEDIGYEAVDNIPLSLLRDLIEGTASGKLVAIGVDIRTRDFVGHAFTDELIQLRHDQNILVEAIFLDCDEDVLIKRYTETRRRHPLANDRALADGIKLERQLLEPVRDCADIIIDTSILTPGILKHQLMERFSAENAPVLSIVVTSFSYRRGIPREADLVFDVRFLRNPHYELNLRHLTGLDPDVAEYICSDPDFSAYMDSLNGMLDLSLPRFEAEGKSYLTIAIGCTGGKHRSVFVCQRLGDLIREKGKRVRLHHRDLEL